MNQQWQHLRSPCNHPSPLVSPSLFSLSIGRARPHSSLTPSPPALDSSPSSGGQLTARERRQLRNERRESRTGANNWREEVEERLLHKPKKRYASWTEELNLDNLALLGPQWWVVRVSRVTGQETAERLARALARNYPDFEFKVYLPANRVKRKLKNGTYSVKSKPLFPGCVFLYCILNKEIHDFIRECDGIGGFLGSKVGNTKKQINRPKPVAVGDMEAIFRQAKEEQENIDRAFEAEQLADENSLKEKLLDVVSTSESTDSKKTLKSSKAAKLKQRSRNRTETSGSSSSSSDDIRFLAPGLSVRVLSGPFVGYTGQLKELNKKATKATVGFMLFGKESFVDLEIDQIVADTARK